MAKFNLFSKLFNSFKKLFKPSTDITISKSNTGEVLPKQTQPKVTQPKVTIEQTPAPKISTPTTSIPKSKTKEPKQPKVEQNIPIEELPTFTGLVLDTVYALIEEAEKNADKEWFRKHASGLKYALDAEIGKYGEDAVAQAMEEAPDSIKTRVETIIYYSTTDNKYRNNLIEFLNLITGTIPTIDEAKEFYDNEEIIYNVYEDVMYQ